MLSPPAHSPIVTRALPEAIYVTIRNAILEGQYNPGQALRQENLARQFNVSRVPVREALGRLEGEGLVVLRPRRGYIVTSLDLDEIVDVFQMRMVLEEDAGRVATKARTAQDIEALRAISAQMERTTVVDSASLSVWLAANKAFHTRLYATSKRKHLCQVISTYTDLVARSIRIAVSMAERLVEAQAEHKDILAAFEKGDADAVAALCRRHCERTVQLLLSAPRARAETATPDVR